MKVMNFETSTKPDGTSSFTFQFLGAASNGCFTGAPDIDLDLLVTLSIAPGGELLTTRVNGKLDKFPAFEMYVRANGQTATPLFQKPPPLGNTPSDLFGFASEPIQKEIQVGAPFNGTWKSNDATKRFELTVSGSTAQWLERRPNGAVLTRAAKLMATMSGGNVYRIERANDDEILQFLEFPDAFLRQEILAANPQPSFILLTRQGDKIIGEWHGLLVKKKANGHLESIVQPKDMTGKNFEFSRTNP